MISARAGDRGEVARDEHGRVVAWRAAMDVVEPACSVPDDAGVLDPAVRVEQPAAGDADGRVGRWSRRAPRASRAAGSCRCSGGRAARRGRARRPGCRRRRSRVFSALIDAAEPARLLLGAQELGGAVGRAVVDDDHLVAGLGCRLADRLEAAAWSGRAG